MQEPPPYPDQELVSSLRETVSPHKIPPHSLEAEQSVLGSLLFNNGAWYSIADRLAERDFYRPEHRLIFKAIKTLSEMGQPCDVITLSEWLSKQGKLEVIGGIGYLGLLADSTPSAANIAAYADIVREKAILRELVKVGSTIMDSAFQYNGNNPSELLENAEKLVFEIAEQGARMGGGFREIKEILTKTLDQIDLLYQSGNAITGVPTGFKDFDEQTSGLQRSDLIIVAGRPSMGKTSFAMNIAEYVAIQAKHPVAVFSMEMPCEQLAMRLISSLARINQQSVRTGKLEDHDWPNITSAIGLLSESPLFIDDTPALNPTELRARARRLASEHGQLGLIVIDYLQLMQVPDSRENRATEVSEISRGLKALAKELQVPVVALSQLNRSLEQRPNKRPVMSDLRESGSIEQDADLIVFIYRDEVYNQDSEDKGTAEIIVAKQRNGPIGTVRLTFLGHLTRFENFSPMDYYHGEH
ncbi:replicative DNA helicase [Beggiatoa leptomitoformis]|uniref:Replicative DNA helicase n=1 Tax=Beggiatoa leptomitoformis TaxID=288004 RepID=A0A2N9YBC7_9GAMM|nr:replicative DNA helicase [Beggiatoa leptomitoformis]ALG66925.1 replicative DNA helicase [Beggiatoa leptomitoformis]AUI67709.1 replicative DNA helicase [Beggiatoa leptomitoformis]